MTPKFRADNIGSLLPPPELLQAAPPIAKASWSTEQQRESEVWECC